VDGYIGHPHFEMRKLPVHRQHEQFHMNQRSKAERNLLIQPLLIMGNERFTKARRAKILVKHQ